MDMEKRGKQESVCRWKQAEDVGYEKGRSNGESQELVLVLVKKLGEVNTCQGKEKSHKHFVI